MKLIDMNESNQVYIWRSGGEMKVDERNVNIVLTQRVERHSYITIRIMNYEWFSPNKTKKHNNPTLPSSPYQGIHTPSENKCSDRAEI